MCGISGFFSTEKSRWTDYEKSLILMQLNESRGEHSTGVAYVNDRKSIIVKDTIKATEFVDNIRSLREHNTLLTHTRYATTGAITKENAHPYKYGNIVGVHNGMLYNHADLYNGEVDSMAIFKVLNDYDNDFIKAFTLMEGNFALAWVNLVENALYLARDDNSPLYLATMGQYNKRYFFSSQELSLKAVVGNAEELEPYVVYRIGSKITKTKIQFKQHSMYYNFQSYYKGTIGFVPTENVFREECSVCGNIPDTLWTNDAGDVVCKDCKDDYF